MKQLGLPGSKSIVFLVAGAIFVAFGVGGVWYREIFPSDWPIALVISALMILLILGPLFIVWWNGTSRLVQHLGNLAAVARAVELGQPRSRVPLNDLPQGFLNWAWPSTSRGISWKMPTNSRKNSPATPRMNCVLLWRYCALRRRLPLGGNEARKNFASRWW